VKHLLGPDNTFLSLNDFCCKYEIDPHPLSFYGLILATKSLQTVSCIFSRFIEHQLRIWATYNKSFSSQKSNIENWLVTGVFKTPESSQKKWLEDCRLPVNDNINWTAAYLLAKECTKSTKLIEFQFKFLHRHVPTNKFSFRIGLQGNENCSFCHTSSESLIRIHLFWSCHQTSHFWNRVTEWLKNINLLPRDYTLIKITALGLRPYIFQFTLLINHGFLLAWYHIWPAKTKEDHPNLMHFITTLKSQYEIGIKSGDTN